MAERYFITMACKKCLFRKKFFTWREDQESGQSRPSADMIHFSIPAKMSGLLKYLMSDKAKWSNDIVTENYIFHKEVDEVQVLERSEGGNRLIGTGNILTGEVKMMEENDVVLANGYYKCQMCAKTHTKEKGITTCCDKPMEFIPQDLSKPIKRPAECVCQLGYGCLQERERGDDFQDVDIEAHGKYLISTSDLQVPTKGSASGRANVNSVDEIGKDIFNTFDGDTLLF